MQSKQNLNGSNFGNLTFGFDIGIASVGWAVLGECDDKPFIRMGVRAFDAAEDKDGKPNNQTRRGARVSRNRFEMRSWRLKQLRKLFLEVGLVNQQQINDFFSEAHPKDIQIKDVWELRTNSLNEELAPIDLARVIYTIVKNRGVKFFSKKEDPRACQQAKELVTPLQDESPALTDKTLLIAPKSEEEKQREGIKSGLNKVAELRAKYPEYRTDAEMVYHLHQDKLEVFANAIRNVDKDYKCVFHRDDLLKELELILDTQAKFYSLFDTPLRDTFCIFENNHVQISAESRKIEHTFYAHVLALLQIQYPPIYAGQMDALIGDCELEEGKKRASKNTFSNERATWLQMLNNLRIYRNGKEEKLNDAERAILLPLPYTQSKLTFAQVREVLRINTGFPAQWREASFNKVSYRSNRKNVNKWVNIIKPNGEAISLDKYITDKAIKKDVNKALKALAEKGRLNFAQLRVIFNVEQHDVFEYVSKREEIVVKHLEQEYPIDIAKLNAGIQFIKILEDKAKTAKKLNRAAMQVYTNAQIAPATTLADLRQAFDAAQAYAGNWQFELSEKTSRIIELNDEANEFIPIEYEDAQKNEEATFIELKGWHALKKALADKHSEFWQSAQVAWQKPLSADGIGKAVLIDEIAEVLTKMQTDKEVAEALKVKELEQEIIETLQAVDFKGYKNLSLEALRKILPSLELGKPYSEACIDAGYVKNKGFKRKKFLPPLETYQYKRFRHGKKTGYTERRFKDVNNPVVARAFSQARLVLNALITEYGSPAYVHIELARDLAKSKKDRDKIGAQQKDNRARRESRRTDLLEMLNGQEPKDGLDLKLQLLDEQANSWCPYTLTELNRNCVINDPNYAQIDHIWPRSKTWDNSMSNKILVHARANQNKGDRIPYQHILNDKEFGNTTEERETHWRRVEKYIAGCHGMSDKKQQRVLAKILDADEFLARNLVDTRYATRLFAHMVRDQLLFEGQSVNEADIKDIDAAENGKTRWDKYQKTRVRTPQGGLVAFLRGRWLGDKIKDREASDKHHAIDALITAACTPALIHRVNTWFANEENQPRRFEKRNDGTYADKGTSEVISKAEARSRGLYLPAPWDDRENNAGGIFRKLFAEQYEQVFVSRLVKEKLNVELHDANPMAIRYYPIPLVDVTIEMLDKVLAVTQLPNRRVLFIKNIHDCLASKNKSAIEVFANGFQIKDKHGQKQMIHFIPLPLLAMSDEFIKQLERENSKNDKKEKLKDTAKKTVPLTKLTTKMLSENELGFAFYSRNKRVVDALVSELKKHNDKADKAFPSSIFYPFGNDKPLIRSIRLPGSRSSGLFIRRGIANLGDALYTEMYKYNGFYMFRNRYKVDLEKTFGFDSMPDGVTNEHFVCELRKNDFVQVKHPNVIYCYREIKRGKPKEDGSFVIDVKVIFEDGMFKGYWGYFQPSLDRPVLRLHDNSPFFLLQDGKSKKETEFQIIAKPDEKDNLDEADKKKPPKYTYTELSDDEHKPLIFALVKEADRMVNDAKSIEKMEINVLGLIEKKQDGLA